MLTAAAVALTLTASTGTALARGGQGFIGVVYPFTHRCETGHDSGACLSTKDLKRLKAARVRNVRWGFSWSQVEATRGTYNWHVPDRMIGAFASRGIRVLPVLRGTPRWAGRTPTTPPLSRKRARNGWRRFLTAATERYGPDGVFWRTVYPTAHPSGPVEPIKVWQVWNEQNHRDSYMHMRPGRYARLLRLSHAALRDGDPKAKVMLGGMPGYVNTHAWRYLRKLYARPGLKRKFDAVALHPYSPDVRHVFVQIRRMRKVMRRHHDGHTPLWISELGWGSKPPDGHGINQGRKGQAHLLRKTFTRLKHRRHRWHVKRVYWFSWRDSRRPLLMCSFCGTSGLFKFDQHPKPAWRSFKHVTRTRR